jgi:hypothetical protein
VAPRAGDPNDLEHAILTVRRTAIDGEAADRVEGHILAIELPSTTPRAALPVLAGPPASIGGSHVG